MNSKEKVFQRLNDLGITYQVIEHPAVFTIDEMDNLNLAEDGVICKNLFLKDAKGKRHFIVTLDKDKKVDLKSLKEQLGSKSLSFASEERLKKYLQLQKGEVTPLGIINDKEGSVEVTFDKDLIEKTKLGVHPNDNTATVWISFKDLEKVIRNNGNIIHFVTI